MPFERSLEIERRLDDVLRLIRTGRYSTPMLAEEVGVSIPTISRIVAALRQRGHDISAEKSAEGWSYVLAKALPSRRLEVGRTDIASQPMAPGQ
jgi:predicted DNA-binding transcriptional regulator YafY